MTTLWPRLEPLLAGVEGRVQDMIYTARGAVTSLYVTYAMRQFPWIDGYQVVQKFRDGITIRLLTREPLTAERLAPLTALLRERLGEMTIDYERVDALSRRPSGKVQLVISSLGSRDQA